MEGRVVADMAATGRTAPFFIAWWRMITTAMYWMPQGRDFGRSAAIFVPRRLLLPDATPT
jgi:hypothetical protein